MHRCGDLHPDQDFRSGADRASEGHFVIVDGLRVSFLLLAAEEVHGFSDDLAAVAVDPSVVGPFGVVDAASHQHLHALVAVLLHRLAQPVEAGDPVPFGVLHPVALLIPQNPTIGIAWARGGEGEMGDLGAALRGAGVRGLTDVACEDDDVLHLNSPLLPPGDRPSDETRPRPSRDARTDALASA